MKIVRIVAMAVCFLLYREGQFPLMWIGLTVLFVFFALNLDDRWAAPAFVLGATGAMGNFAVAAANHWRMPFFSPELVRQADARHVLIGPDSRLLWLADVHGNSAYNFSVGDGLIVLGLLYFVGYSISRLALRPYQQTEKTL